MAARFRPRFIFEDELGSYGLPDVSQQNNIMSLVDSASTLIEEHCGRTDGDGNGSLVYTTYQERLLLQSRGRNVLRVSFKPLVALTPTVVSLLSLSGSSFKVNNWFTGVQANTVVKPDTTLSPIISCSGRYGYGRRDSAAVYPDLNLGMNLLQVAGLFGGPPGFTAIDASAIDFDTQTGEIWVPAGIMMSQYTELVVTYNSGYSPFNIPAAIKDACAALVRNLLARGGGTTGLKGISGQGMVNVTFTDALIDPTIASWLQKFVNVIAY